MGGQLIKGYSIEGQSLCSTGIVKSWKLFRGHNSSTQAAASIFLIQKKQLKKQDRQEVIKLSKKEAAYLLRVRHPGVLAIVQPLTQDENILAFVTQKIEGNISLLIKQNKLQQFITSQLQLKLFLYPFIETIAFIHDSLKQVHLAISFENIYLTTEGKWKLAGFGYNQSFLSQDLTQLNQKFYDLSFSAPQIVIQHSYSNKSDIFSLGLLILHLIQFVHKSFKPKNTITDSKDYEKQMNDLKVKTTHPIIQKSDNPVQLGQLLKGVLSWDQKERWNVNDILLSSWMNDNTLVTVKYLDKISHYDSKQQLDFLKGLSGVLDDFPQRVITRIVVPKLLDQLKYNHLIASIVYIIIDLLKKTKVEESFFKKVIWPSLKAVTQAKEMTAQAIYLFVLHIDVLQKFVGEPDTSTHLLPLYLKCYDCPPKLKLLALSLIQKMSKKVDYQFLKTKILPRLVSLFKESNVEIRKEALKGLYSILKLIDTQTISSSILPGLEAVRRAGSDPFVNAITIHMYRMLGESLPIDTISTKILPALTPTLTDPSNNRTEFLQIKSVIIHMIDRIDRDLSKSFQNNSVNTSSVSFTEIDFKFKEADYKLAQDKKGNYNFLSNYIQVKTEPVNSGFVQPNNPSSEQQPMQLQNPYLSSFSPKFQQNVSNQKPSSTNTYLPSANTSLPFQVSSPLTNSFLPTFQSNPPISTSFSSPLQPSFPSPLQPSHIQFGDTLSPSKQTIPPHSTNYEYPIDPLKQFNNGRPNEITNVPTSNIGGNFFRAEPQLSMGDQPKSSILKNKQFKLMPGASIQTEPKKFVGPSSLTTKSMPLQNKQKEIKHPQPTNTETPPSSFTYQPQHQVNLFSSNFNDFSQFGINQPNKNVTPYSFSNSSGLHNSSLANPFSELEAGTSTTQGDTLGMNVQGFGSKGLNQPTDIYSFFQSEQMNFQMPKGNPSSKGSLDLI